MQINLKILARNNKETVVLTNSIKFQKQLTKPVNVLTNATDFT